MYSKLFISLFYSEIRFIDYRQTYRTYLRCYNESYLICWKENIEQQWKHLFTKIENMLYWFVTLYCWPHLSHLPIDFFYIMWICHNIFQLKIRKIFVSLLDSNILNVIYTLSLRSILQQQTWGTNLLSLFSGRF